MEDNQQEEIRKKEHQNIIKEFKASKKKECKTEINPAVKFLSFITGGLSSNEEKGAKKAEHERLKTFKKYVELKEKEAQSKETEKSH